MILLKRTETECHQRLKVPGSVDDGLDGVEAGLLELLAVRAGDPVLLEHLDEEGPELLLLLHLGHPGHVGLLLHRRSHLTSLYDLFQSPDECSQ